MVEKTRYLKGQDWPCTPNEQRQMVKEDNRMEAERSETKAEKIKKKEMERIEGKKIAVS